MLVVQTYQLSRKYSFSDLSVSNATVSNFAGSGSGTIGLNLVDDDTIVDTNGMPLAGKGAGNGNVTGQVYTIDKTAPQAGNLAAASITAGGATTYSFTVVFSDNLAIDSASLDSSDIRVTGPSGFNQLAALISVTPATSGTPRTATYRIAAPGGSWDTADNGTYTLALQANQVSDTAGNPAEQACWVCSASRSAPRARRSSCRSCRVPERPIWWSLASAWPRATARSQPARESRYR